MRTCILVVWLATGCLVCWTLGQQPEKKDPPKAKVDPTIDRKKVKELMGRKTEHAQKVLEALMKNDLTAAGQHAEEITRVRKEAAWHIVKTDVYNLWSDQFSAAAERVIKAAKERNAELAKLGYLEMTMVCFNCHAYVRDLGDISTRGDGIGGR